ncbi:MAG: glycosyltransferase family 9 protein [Candidatus Pacebacteria bacterium]|nr:glycosyltransferase family 9 protein [Candidatus Paceibacterota bacterium]
MKFNVKNLEFNTDCKHFKGDIPCKFHKLDGRKCPCKDFIKIDKRIVVIKIGAIGDVIRTTPLLRIIKKKYPNSEITWLTNNPEILPSLVDCPLEFNKGNVVQLLADKFDILYNLDKDEIACSLANLVQADIKKGFRLHNGRCFPINQSATHKWLTGLDDDLNKKNRKSYPEEIFEICGFRFNKEKYVLDLPDFSKVSFKFSKLKHPVIGLNTGCGIRWQTRLWPEENWIELAKKLKEKNFEVVLLGGEQEDKKNKKIAKNSKAKYFGYFPLNDFIYLVNQCDLIVTGATMALHIAIGLDKNIILLNNIFNKNEFELYGLGEVIEPDINCVGCYKQQFDERCKVKNCMKLITVSDVYNKIIKWIKE